MQPTGVPPPAASASSSASSGGSEASTMNKLKAWWRGDNLPQTQARRQREQRQQQQQQQAQQQQAQQPPPQQRSSVQPIASPAIPAGASAAAAAAADAVSPSPVSHSASPSPLRTAAGSSPARLQPMGIKSATSAWAFRAGQTPPKPRGPTTAAAAGAPLPGANGSPIGSPSLSPSPPIPMVTPERRQPASASPPIAGDISSSSPLFAKPPVGQSSRASPAPAEHTSPSGLSLALGRAGEPARTHVYEHQATLPVPRNIFAAAAASSSASSSTTHGAPLHFAPLSGLSGAALLPGSPIPAGQRKSPSGGKTAVEPSAPASSAVVGGGLSLGSLGALVQPTPRPSPASIQALLPPTGRAAAAAAPPPAAGPGVPSSASPGVSGPAHDSAEAFRKQHIVRDVRSVDGQYKRKLRKQQFGLHNEALSPPSSTHALPPHLLALPPQAFAAAAAARALSPAGDEAAAEGDQSHPSGALMVRHFSPQPDPTAGASRSSSPSSAAVHVLLQPSGSDKFWLTVVLASWPRMLQSSLLIKMIERDGIPPGLRHKVWYEILAGAPAGGAARAAQRREGSISGQMFSSSPSNTVSPSTSLTSSSPPVLFPSSMSLDIQRMQAEPSRRMSDVLPPPSAPLSAAAAAAAHGATGSLTSSSPPLSMPLATSAPTSSEMRAAAAATPAAAAATSPTNAMRQLGIDQPPMERCAFCSGVSSSSSSDGDGCTCNTTSGTLLLPLHHPSPASIQLVLEGVILQRHEEAYAAAAAAAAADHQQQQAVVHDPSGGYVQGLSYLAEVLLASMPPVAATACLVGLLSHRFFVSYLAMNVHAISARFHHFDATLTLNAPGLAQHFARLGLPSDCFYLEYAATLCAKQLPLEWTARVWDGYLLHGEVHILKATIALFQLMQPMLMTMGVSQLVRAVREPDSLDIFPRPRAPTPAPVVLVEQPALAPVLITPRALFARPPSSGASSPTSPNPAANGAQATPPPPLSAIPPRVSEVVAPQPARVGSTHDDGEYVKVDNGSSGSSSSTSTIPIAGSKQSTSSSGSTSKSRPSSSWWWPFSTSKGDAATGSPPTDGAGGVGGSGVGASATALTITLADFLMAIQQVELPPQVDAFYRIPPTPLKELANRQHQLQQQQLHQQQHQQHHQQHFHPMVLPMGLR